VKKSEVYYLDINLINPPYYTLYGISGNDSHHLLSPYSYFAIVFILVFKVNEKISQKKLITGSFHTVLISLIQPPIFNIRNLQTSSAPASLSQEKQGIHGLIIFSDFEVEMRA